MTLQMFTLLDCEDKGHGTSKFEFVPKAQCLKTLCEKNNDLNSFRLASES